MRTHDSPSSPSAARDLCLAITLIVGGACTPKDDQATEGDVTATSTLGSTGTTTSTNATGPTTGPGESTTEPGTTGPGESTTGPDESTGPGTTGPGESTDGPVMGCSEHTSVDACCCFELVGEPPVGVSTVCAAGQPPLCPKVVFECDPIGIDTPEAPCVAAEDEAAVNCALQALATATPGSLHIEYVGNNYYWYRNVRYALQGDGTTYLIHSLAEDVSEVFDATGRFMLKPPAFFTDCLAQDIGARGDCLRSGVMGAASEVCLAEFDNQDI